MSTVNSKNVFVIYGNKRIKREMFAFLRMLNLSPIPWDEAVLLTRISASYPDRTLNSLLQQAHAAVALLTADDEAQLRSEFFVNSDPVYDRVLSHQPRPNVVFEIGLALSHNWLASRMILVEIGNVSLCHALEGRHRIRLSNKIDDRMALVRSLVNAGCTPEIPSNELLREVGDFRLEKHSGTS